MTPLQIQLVRQSWAAVEPRRETIARLFYDRLFEQTPRLRPMFRHDLHAQGAKLMATLNVVVVHLDQLDTLLETLRQLGVRHLEWQVLREHYDLVDEALQWALAQGLGDRYTPEVAQAWRLAYDAVAAPMKAAAYPDDRGGDRPPPAARSSTAATRAQATIRAGRPRPAGPAAAK